MNWKAIAIGAAGGALTAARVDYSSFKGWKSFSDAYRYEWNLAAWRWLQGAIVGAITAGGLTQLMEP